MFHRVVVDVVDMMLEIVIVPDQVFPIAALPNTALTPGNTNLRTKFVLRQPPRETRFDLRPTIDGIVVTVRQPP